METRLFFLTFWPTKFRNQKLAKNYGGAGGNNINQEYGQSTKFYTGRLRPEFQPIGLYTIFD